MTRTPEFNLAIGDQIYDPARTPVAFFSGTEAALDAAGAACEAAQWQLDVDWRWVEDAGEARCAFDWLRGNPALVVLDLTGTEPSEIDAKRLREEVEKRPEGIALIVVGGAALPFSCDAEFQIGRIWSGDVRCEKTVWDWSGFPEFDDWLLPAWERSF